MEEDITEFGEIYSLVNLIKDPACFKSIQNPSPIAVNLTNKRSSFHNSCSIETGLSDHRNDNNSLKNLS